MEAGLLEPADWTALWVRPAEAGVPPPGRRPAYHLRHEFTIDDHVALDSVRAYVTAHGLYELFINGHRVGNAELTPGFTDYRTALQVQTFDLAMLIHPGTNVVGAVLSDGWFRGFNGMFRDADCFGTKTALLVQLMGDTDNGDPWQVGTDGGWRSSVGALMSVDLMEGVFADLRLDPHGWASAGFDDSLWSEVELDSSAMEGLLGSAAPPVRRVEFRRPVSVTRAPSGAQVVDMGENIVGWVRLGELGPAGNETTLTYAEALSPEGEASQRNLQPDDMPPGEDPPSVGQVDLVVSAGRPGEGFEPRHSTKGFRYVGVEGAVRDLSADDITGVVVHTDFRRTGSFRCSDDRLNRLHEIAVRSFVGNAVDIPTDCPTRERSGWTGDWAVFAPAAAFLFDVAGFSDKWLRDLASQQFDDGVVPNWIPDHFGPAIRTHPFLATNLGSAGWGDASVIVPWEMYLAYGDKGLLARQWRSMVAWVERAVRMARDERRPTRAAARPQPLPHEEFLWDTGFHFGEWLEPGVQLGWEDLKVADFSAVSTAYLRHSSRLLSQVARVLGDTESEDRYSRISESVRAAWQAEFAAPDGTVTPHTQATLVRALVFDLVDAGVRPRVVEQLVALIRGAGNHLGTGFLATPHLLPALADNGELEVAYDVLLQTSPPSWLHMVEQGATTVTELWEALDENGIAHESLNHYSKGAVIGFLHQYIAGLRTQDDGPGYRRFRVEPRPGGGVDWAEATHESPYGSVAVSWRIEHDVFRLHVIVPAGTSAEVRLPDGTRAEIAAGTSMFECPFTDQPLPAKPARKTQET